MSEVYDVEPTEESTAVVVRGSMENYVPAVRRSPEEARLLVEQVDALIAGVMRDGTDYGTIPGTPKPSLYKAGAERLAMFFGLGSVVELMDKTEDYQGGFFAYTVRVGVGPIDNEGVVRPIQWSIGSCNSMESKYRKLVQYGKAADLPNTLQKMAQKRAFVGAVLMATNSSDRFTQDVEEMPREAFGGKSDDDKPLMPPVKRPAKTGAPGDFLMTFGKHAGKSLSEIAAENPGYLPWLLNQLNKKSEEGKLPDDQQGLYTAVAEMVP